jgi:acetyl-CoA synthetase
MPLKKKKKTKKTKVRKKSSKKVKKKTKVRKKKTKKNKVIKKSSKKVKKKTKVRKKIVSENTNENSKELIIKTKPQWVKNSLATRTKYKDKYLKSIKNNDEFWRKEGKRITWIKPYNKIKDVKYSSKEVKIKWFQDGTLNASANCIDRHLKIKKIKQQLYGLEMILKTVKKYHTNNFMKKFLKQRMV